MRIAAAPSDAKAGFPAMAAKHRKIGPKLAADWQRAGIFRQIPNLSTRSPRNQQFQTAIPA